jgi:hypothetical protein
VNGNLGRNQCDLLKRKHQATSCYPMFSGGEKNSYLLFCYRQVGKCHFNRKNAILLVPIIGYALSK